MQNYDISPIIWLSFIIVFSTLAIVLIILKFIKKDLKKIEVSLIPPKITFGGLKSDYDKTRKKFFITITITIVSFILVSILTFVYLTDYGRFKFSLLPSGRYVQFEANWGSNDEILENEFYDRYIYITYNIVHPTLISTISGVPSGILEHTDLVRLDSDYILRTASSDNMLFVDWLVAGTGGEIINGTLQGGVRLTTMSEIREFIGDISYLDNTIRSEIRLVPVFLDTQNYDMFFSIKFMHNDGTENYTILNFGSRHIEGVDIFDLPEMTRLLTRRDLFYAQASDGSWVHDTTRLNRQNFWRHSWVSWPIDTEMDINAVRIPHPNHRINVGEASIGYLL